MDKVTRIKARNARKGMILCFTDSRFNIIIDDVDFLRDGDVKLSVGDQGTGTEFRDPEEYIWVQLP